MRQLVEVSSTVGKLPDRTLQDIARSLHLLKVEAGTIIYQANQPAIGLYLMKWGAVEIYRVSSSY